jgi:hypothetical protein
VSRSNEKRLNEKMSSNLATTNSSSSTARLLPWIVKNPRRDATAVIRSGLDFIFAQRNHDFWANCDHPKSVWTTANILVQLADSAKYLSHSRQQDIQLSLDWLTHRQRNGYWQNDGRQPDCLTTARAVIALRSHGRSVPSAAMEFLESCRLPDGSFVSLPAKSSDPDLLKILTLTVTASRALQYLDPSTESFLVHGLGLALPVPQACNASRFNLCAEILDWPAGQASISLLNKVTQLTVEAGRNTALGDSLLLRSLLRLRISRSWAVAARLREMQSQDGGWPVPSSMAAKTTGQKHVFDPCDDSLVVAATAISALVLAESQPGLYFGSDQPAPQRF